MNSFRLFFVVFAGAWLLGLGGRLLANEFWTPEIGTLPTGATIPDIVAFDVNGRAHDIRMIVADLDANVVIVLASGCSFLLGELDSWARASEDSDEMRPVVFVYAEDPAYLFEVSRYVNIDIYRLAEADLERMGALRTPVAYVLDDGQRIDRSALGADEGSALRYSLLTGSSAR